MLDARFVRIGVEVVLDLRNNFIPLGLFQKAESVRDAIEVLREVEDGVVETVDPRLKAGEVEKVPHERGETVRLVDDDLRVLLPLDGVLARNLLDHCRIRFDHRERRAEVVRDVGDELLLDLIRLGKLRVCIVECVGQVVDFADEVMPAEIRIVIAVRQRLGALCHACNGLADENGDKSAHDKAERDRKQPRIDGI